jgi:hypothetical protein
MPVELSLEEVRTFLIHCHMLDHYRHKADKEGVLSVFDRLGCIQYDPLNVVGRNPCLVMQSRIDGFTVELLDRCLYEDRLLLDGWDKEMSVYQMADWPYCARIRHCHQLSVIARLQYRGQSEVLSYADAVIEEIQKQGPLSAKQINLGNCKASRWGHRKISGAVMDYLFANGRLGVKKKTNAQKTYALIEDLFPPDILCAVDPFQSDEEFYEWYFLRRIAGLGVCWTRNGGGWNGYYLSDQSLRKSVFAVLEEKGYITRIIVPEINENLYMRTSDLSLLDNDEGQDGFVRFLAPLDNFLWDRGFINKLFDFQYSWEVYLPAEKRKYGYYVLPVLYKNRLIARMEPDKQETSHSFTVKNWWWEEGVHVDGEIKEAIILSMERFAAYLCVDGYAKENERIIFA